MPLRLVNTYCQYAAPVRVLGQEFDGFKQLAAVIVPNDISACKDAILHLWTSDISGLQTIPFP